jgi:phosphoadenosine phosphosulfate reductase
MTTTATPSPTLDLAALNASWATQTPQQIVKWAAEHFGDDIVMSSSFGAESALLLHMASTIRPGIRVIFVNTGYLFPETHRFMEELRQRLDLNVWTYRTRNDPIAYLHRAGEENPQWRKDIPACCAANKNEPFDRAMKELSPRAWIRGVRADQAATRANVSRIEWAPRYNCYAISPILSWTRREIHAYLKLHNLPYHPLTEAGFWSIGCNPHSCTRAITDAADPRSGRWADSDKVECGINLTNSLDSANL